MTRNSMSRYLHFLFFISAFPIFFDLTTFTLVLHSAQSLDDLFALRPSFPIPISFICLNLYLLIGLFHSLFRTKIFFFHLNNSTVFALFTICFSLISSVLLGVRSAIFLQVYAALIFLLVFPLISERRILYRCYRWYFYGISLWILCHFLSILIMNNYSFMNVDRDFNFGRAFGFTVYQAWVSYPVTLSFQLIFIAFLFRARVVSLISSLAVIFLLIIVGFFGQTRLFGLDIITFLLLLIFIFMKGMQVLQLRNLLFLFFVSATCVFGYIFYGTRIATQGASDRFQLISEALDVIFGDLGTFFFWGAGSVHSFAHNFVLDFIINYGIFSFLTYLFCLLLVLHRLYSVLRASGSFSLKVPFLFASGVVLAQNSFFNTAITQPLAIASFMFSLILILSLPVGSREAGESSP